jgi:hypothetical protein
MSYLTAFCNNTTDLQGVVSDIDKFDRKRVLPPNWVESGTSNLYYLHNVGAVDQLYMDGAEQTKVTDTPNAMGEYEYQSSADRLDAYIGGSSTSDMNSRVFESGQDWDGLKTTVTKEQADRMRSYLNRPIYKRNNANYQGASDRDYDWIVVRINSILACADLVRSQDPERAEILEAMATNDEGTGLLDKLKRKEYVMWNETTFRSESGVISEISINGSSTGYIEDIKLTGPPGVDYDEVRVVISTGATFAPGTASGAKFDVYVKDDTGLRMNKAVDAETINGDYQYLAYGAMIRFQAGVYTTNDEWSVTFQSDSIPVGTVKSGQIYR